MKGRMYRVEIEYDNGLSRDLELQAGELAQDALCVARGYDQADGIPGRPVRYRVFDDAKNELLLETETRVARLDFEAEDGGGGKARIPAGEWLLFCCRVVDGDSEKWQFEFQSLRCYCGAGTFAAATEKV